MPPTQSDSPPRSPSILLESARRGDHGAFRELAQAHRRELRAHCYRMLGSIHDAEDAVQETLLRAWRGLGEFQSRASFRNWLYKIATHACLNMLAARRRVARLLPHNIGSPAQSLPREPPTEIAWLEPYPDEPLEDLSAAEPGPDARYEVHEAVQLAFVAAVQQLPPLQRAVLLLRDVLGWSATEAAHLLDTSVASITSALQRARATMEKNYDSGERPASQPDERQRELLDRYVAAWETADLEGFVALLKEQAILSMPPYREWFLGREAIRGFFVFACNRYGGRGAFRLLPTSANRQPAFALYARSGAAGDYLAHSIQVLSLRDEHIAVLINFKDPRLFDAFGLPARLTV
jgi:RNA polymerase sigma-70 factor, ECF subfamily